jgi:hypothetical protein
VERHRPYAVERHQADAVERHRLSKCGGEASTLCGGEGCSLLYVKLIDGRYVLIMTSATPGVLYEVFLPRDPMLRAVPHPIYSHLTTLLTGRVFSPRRVHAPHETPRFPRCTAFPHVYSDAAPRVAHAIPARGPTRPHATLRVARLYFSSWTSIDSLIHPSSHTTITRTT